MVSLLLGYCADAIDEIEGLFEVRKSEGAGEVVFVDDLPVRNFLVQFFKVGAPERRNATAARDAGFGGEGHASLWTPRQENRKRGVRVVSFAPLGICHQSTVNPRLPPWAAFLRCSAAESTHHARIGCGLKLDFNLGEILLPTLQA